MTEPQIIFEDADILVVNKPAGMTVNRSETTKEETLQDWAEGKLGFKIEDLGFKNARGEGKFESPEETFVNRAGIVHRLDKETSGIILIAKNVAAFVELQRQFKEREVHKEYLALAHGKILPAEGEINVPVGRLQFNRKRFGVVAGGRESITRYKVTTNYELRTKNKKELLSLVELYPKTGRTHQIRVHLKHLNHPIFADELYAGRKTARDDRKFLSRLFLHAAKITFKHPTTHQELSFQAPLPEELDNLLKQLV